MISDGDGVKPPDFDDAFRQKLALLFAWRRDVRRFRSDALPPASMEKLLSLANLAPSVGLSQPWRFVLVESAERRRRMCDNFARANAAALSCYNGERAAHYAGLKLSGLVEAPVHLAVFAESDPAQGLMLGRKTMPETVAYSTITAIHTLWLAARAEGIGMGWVSILEPDAVNHDLDVPAEWRLIGYFCLGFPQEETDAPELERAQWEKRASPGAMIFRR